MSSHTRIPDNILRATESLSIEGFSQLDTWQWFENLAQWVLKCRLSIQSTNVELVPNQSDWYIILEKEYPFGPIEFLPAIENGISKTFQHQFYNDVSKEGLPWRVGKICVKPGLYQLSREDYDIEPYEISERLKWNVIRAQKWLEDASSGTLVRQGELFELPDYNTAKAISSVVFCESTESYNIWKNYIGRTGTVDFVGIGGPNIQNITLSFSDHLGNTIYEPPWGQLIKNIRSENINRGAWALVPKPIVIPPWQAPMDWGELLQAMNLQSFPYRTLLRRISMPLRDGQEHCVLIGFPVLKKIGDLPTQIHWQAIRLPALSCEQKHDGFRTNNKSLFSRDMMTIFRNHKRINWQKSENWHPNEIHNRGKLHSSITESKVLIIGAGALGSMIAELLVRGGLKHITIVDHDKTEIGNIIRHTLTMDDVGEFKAKSLAHRLLRLSPFVESHVVDAKIEQIKPEYIEKLKDTNIVVDCSGSDDVLHYIRCIPWTHSPMYFSVSTGLQAKRLFILVSRRKKFPFDFFHRHLKKWLLKDMNEYEGPELPRSGGIGCWHPTFPARGDEVWMCAAAAMQYFNEYVDSKADYSKFAVFEQIQNKGRFAGIVLTEECDDR